MSLLDFFECQLHLLDLLIQGFGAAAIALTAQACDRQSQPLDLELPLLDEQLLFQHQALQ